MPHAVGRVPATTAPTRIEHRDATTDAGIAAQIVNSQKPDQWLASKFKGTDVIGADNEKIGDVSDILFDKTGKIEAFVVERRRLPRHGRQGRRAGAGLVPGRRRATSRRTSPTS